MTCYGFFLKMATGITNTHKNVTLHLIDPLLQIVHTLSGPKAKSRRHGECHDVIARIL